MSDFLDDYTDGFETTGNLDRDVKTLLFQHSAEYTYHHVKAVAKEAVRLAKKFGGNEHNAEIAAWLHDISTIIPNEYRIEAANSLAVEVLAEEEIFPMIIHQKLSAVMARVVFGIEDEDILSAISCHTTLKANASMTDKLVFVADKVAWDQPGKPPYFTEILAALEVSIDDASLVYLNHLWDNRENLKVLHPWAAEARTSLMAKRLA